MRFREISATILNDVIFFTNVTQNHWNSQKLGRGGGGVSYNSFHQHHACWWLSAIRPAGTVMTKFGSVYWWNQHWKVKSIEMFILYLKCSTMFKSQICDNSSIVRRSHSMIPRLFVVKYLITLLLLIIISCFFILLLSWILLPWPVVFTHQTFPKFAWISHTMCIFTHGICGISGLLYIILNKLMIMQNKH